MPWCSRPTAQNDPDIIGINAASAALHVSDIPFLGPIGAVRVGLKDGQFIVNPSYEESKEGLLRLVVAGTKDGIVMIEAGASEVQEDTIVDAIEFAHTEIKKICARDRGAAREGRQAEAEGNVLRSSTRPTSTS